MHNEGPLHKLNLILLQAKRLQRFSRIALDGATGLLNSRSVAVLAATTPLNISTTLCLRHVSKAEEWSCF